MTLPNYCEWAVDIDASQLQGESIELKFVVTNASGHVMMWECGCNRCLTLPDMKKGMTVMYSLDQAFFPSTTPPSPIHGPTLIRTAASASSPYIHSMPIFAHCRSWRTRKHAVRRKQSAANSTLCHRLTMRR